MKTKIISLSLLLFLISESNKAQNWEFVGLDSLAIYQLYISGDTLYAGTRDKINNLNSGLYFSSNKGSNWIRLDSQLGEGSILALERNVDNTLYIIKNYVATGRTLYKTTDNGQNWEVVNNISNYPIQWFGISPFNPNEMYAIDVSGGGGNNFNYLFKSTNRGNSWENIGSFPGSSHGSELRFAFDLNDSTNLYVAVDARLNGLYLFKSTDEGENWFYVSTPPFFPTDIYSDRIIPDRIYLFGGPYISSNGGYNWILADSGLSDTAYYRSFFQDQLNANLIYILRTDGLYVSDSDTIFWNRVEDSEYLPLDLPGISNLKNIFIDNAKKKIYIGTTSGIYKKDFITGVKSERDPLNSFLLEQNFPNPFNPSTTISYSLKENALVSLKVYDVLGTQVAELVNSQQSQGTYNISFSAIGLSSGIYIYRLITMNGDHIEFSDTKRMILVK